MADYFNWNLETIRELVDLHKSGKTRQEIADHFGLKVTTIDGKLSNLKTSNESGKLVIDLFDWNEERVEEAVELWNSGVTEDVVCSTMGCPKVEFRYMKRSHADRFLSPVELKRKQRSRYADLPKPPRAPSPVKGIRNSSNEKSRQKSIAELEALGDNRPGDGTKFVAEGSKPVPFSQVRGCKFPLSARGDVQGSDTPCCNMSIKDRSFCEYHYKLCYTPSRYRPIGRA